MSDQPTLDELAASMSSREDFGRFMVALADDFERTGTTWENQTLDRFLEAMGAWVDMAPVYYRNMGSSVNADEPQWRVFADICWPHAFMSEAGTLI